MLCRVSSPWPPHLGPAKQLRRIHCNSIQAGSPAKDSNIGRGKGICFAEGAERDVLGGPVSNAGNSSKPGDDFFARTGRFAGRLKESWICRHGLSQKLNRIPGESGACPKRSNPKMPRAQQSEICIGGFHSKLGMAGCRFSRAWLQAASPPQP